jgi:hypothetical protein
MICRLACHNGCFKKGTMQLLSAFHECAYLTAQTISYKAVKIYLDFGFRPYITDESQKKGWSVISRLLGLSEFNIHNSL